jgi:hypothetical protein
VVQGTCDVYIPLLSENLDRDKYLDS